jgi:zinc transporter 1/2/3
LRLGPKTVLSRTESPIKSVQHQHGHDTGTVSTGDAADKTSNITLVPHSNSAAGSETELDRTTSRALSTGPIPGRVDDFSYPPGGEDHLGHGRHHGDHDDRFAAQMTALFILEFGVLFHSIFIGLTLAVTGSNFKILYIVLTFHQTFEGLGLGSRLATADWPSKKLWMPWVLGIAFGVTTPIAIAAGLGVHSSFDPQSPSTLITQGVFDSVSAGILIYTGLVELMAHEFMFNPEIKKGKMSMVMFAYGSMCFGAFLMALLGKWA